MFFSGLIRFLLGPKFRGQPHVSQCVTNTRTQDKVCLQTEEGFFSVVCRRVSYSHYVLIRRLSKAFVTMATGQWTRHRVCRQLRTSPSHLTCLCALPLGLMGKLHSEALPHTPHPTPPPPFPTALRYKPQSL